MISLTGLVWTWAAFVSLIFVGRLVVGYRKGGPSQVFFGPFAVFFFLMAISFILYGSPLWANDPRLISNLLIVGHVILWLGFGGLAEIPWRLRWHKYVSIWVPRAFVFIGGTLQLYLEVSGREVLPAQVEFGQLFTISQWGLPISSLLAMMLTLWAFTLPIGVIFFQEAAKIQGKGRVSSIGIASVFVLASVAGALSTWNHAPIMLVLETCIVWLGFTILLVTILARPNEI